MTQLPLDETELLEGAVGRTIDSIELLAMRDCGEEYRVPPPEGYVRTTWGLCLGWKGGGVALTWGDDGIGTPYRVAACKPEQLKQIETLQPQDVSILPPWNRYVGLPLEAHEVLWFETNYDSRHAWRGTPWGVLLRFASGPLLVASAVHEDPLGNHWCNDEIVVAFSPAAIDGLRSIRTGRHDEWSPAVDWRFDQEPNVAAITTIGVIERRLPVLLVQHGAEDHDWAFLCGTTNEDKDGRVIGMGEMLRMDPTLHEIADLPPGWKAWRASVGGPWNRSPDPNG